LHLPRAIGTVSKAAPKSLLDEYKQQVSQGVLEYDDRQYHVLRYLTRLCGFMNAPGYKPNPIQTPPRQPAGHQSSSLYKKPAASTSYGPKVIHYTGPASQVQQVPVEATEPGTEVWAGSNHARAAQDTIHTSTSSSTEPPASSESLPLSSSEQIMRGVYVYGEVGTGKTLLMDKFFRACTTHRKRRVHFHEFLLEIHQRIRVFKQGLIEQYGRSVQLEKNVPSERDAIEQVALQVADEAWLLCFDEFQVTDVADALILHRFFNVLWNRGVVLVATSNRPPTDLYKNGINRSYFEYVYCVRGMDGVTACVYACACICLGVSNESATSSPPLPPLPPLPPPPPPPPAHTGRSLTACPSSALCKTCKPTRTTAVGCNTHKTAI